VGVGAVIIKDNKILLEKRKYDPGKGKWSVPGGVVDLGETTEEAVTREVKEETNLDVENPQLVDVVCNISVDSNVQVKYHFIIIDYLMRLKGGVLNASSDADELKWVKLDEVEKFDLTKTFREFMERNREKLKSGDTRF
jgi:mutator protein MutT